MTSGTGAEDAQPGPPPRDDALGLLRRYEPVLRYTRGDLFRPIPVEAFVSRASLWEAADGRTIEVVAAGALDLDLLVAEATRRRGVALFLRFVQRPLGLRARWRWRRQVRRPRLRRTARLAQVGLFLRLVEAMFRLALALRGTVVPSGVTAAADLSLRDLAGPPVYYGRVLRDGGYTVLQYWIFYAMNDWRSTFHGINDHEGDWEHVFVFLAEAADGELEPAWVTCSAHDRRGDDMRRRHDDPDLEWEGSHPVVYVAGGSHANYPRPGDYVVTVPIAFLAPVVRLVRRVRGWLGGSRDTDAVAEPMNLPYVDYARGDGDAIGPGTGIEWGTCVIDDTTPWVVAYTGLWGLDTRDRLGGERGPGGPRYDRRGAVRAPWADPVGWVGLHKVDPSPGARCRALRSRVAALDADLDALTAEVEQRRAAMRQESAEIASLAAHARAAASVAARRAELRRSHDEVLQLRKEIAMLTEERRMHLESLAEPDTVDDPQAHLVQPAQPWIEERSLVAQLRRVWAALSTPLLAVALVVALTTPRGNMLAFLVTVFAVFVAIEAVLRGRIATFTAAVLVVTGAVSIVWGVAVGFLADWPTALAATIGLASLVLLIGNLRELRG